MRNYIQLLPDKPSWEFSEPWRSRDGYTVAEVDEPRTMRSDGRKRRRMMDAE